MHRFLVELYEEHLLEASALYEQLQLLPTDYEIGWRDIRDFEDRLEAHLDALLVGNQLAAVTCNCRALKGDAGELYAAVRVWCRRGELSPLGRMFNTSLKKAARLRAIADALRDDLPSDWEKWLLDLPTKDTRLLSTVLLITAYRRVRGADRLATQALDQSRPENVSQVLWACARVGGAEQQSIIRQYLNSPDLAIKHMAALSLVRLGDSTALEHARREPLSDWALKPLALAGGPSDWRMLSVQFLADPTPARIEALAVVGEGETVGGLVALTGTPVIADSVAKALERICDMPKQVSADPTECQKWYERNRERFIRGGRYRRGSPYSPQVLVAELECEKRSYAERQLAAEELAVRYSVDGGFEPDLPTGQQERAISRIKSLIQAKFTMEDRVDPWAFAARTA